jgi:hypothetical protein
MKILHHCLEKSLKFVLLISTSCLVCEIFFTAHPDFQFWLRHCLYVFGFCWVLIVKIRNAEQIIIWKAMAKSPASIALIVYTFIAVWFVGGLSAFHLYLMSTNQVKAIFTCLGW